MVSFFKTFFFGGGSNLRCLLDGLKNLLQNTLVHRGDSVAAWSLGPVGAN